MNLRDALQDPRHCLHRMLQEVEFRTGIRCAKPSDVWIKLTERCNCRCRMCNIWKINRSAAGELSTEEWKKVFQGLRQWLGPRKVWLTGGEPLLRSDCIALIHYASSIGLSIGMITNGTLLLPDLVRSLADSGLREYHVSIDSLTPDIHNRLRGIPDAHEKATRGLLQLKETTTRLGHHMRMVVKTIIMRRNHHEILPLLDWVEGHGLDGIKFQPVESTLREEEDPRWFEKSPFWPNEDELPHVLSTIDHLIAKKNSGSKIINSSQELINFNSYFSNPLLHYEQAKSHTMASDRQRRGCRNAVSWMEISSRGGLRMCRHMPPQGDVKRVTPRDLWREREACWLNGGASCHRQHHH